MNTWNVEKTRILTRPEIKLVLVDQTRKSRRSINTRKNLVIFRLATCCGLRVSELTAVRLCDVQLSSTRQTLKVVKGKGGKSRVVPLHWDAGTLADLTAWKELRIAEGALGTDLLLTTRDGQPIDRLNARKRFQAACKVLGRPLTIHDGRHSFVSHALHGGRSIAEVRDAAGHSNLATTSIYAHLVEDDGKVGNLFD